MAQGQHVDDDVKEKVKSLVGSILAHPTFRETINNIFGSESNSSSASTSHEPAAASGTRPVSSDTRPAPSTSSAFARPQYQTAAQEFFAIFRRGGSTQRHDFQRGFNHRTSQTRRGRRQAPYTSSRSSSSSSHGHGGSSGRRADAQFFRTKEVVLLPDSKRSLF